MKVELSLAQLNKLSRLTPESWKTLLVFVSKGGSGDFTPDLSPLREAGLVLKVGPLAYIKFPIDGALPTQLPQFAKRKGGNDFPAFMAIWRSKAPGYITGASLAALKRFVNNYSVDEFRNIVYTYINKTDDPTLQGMWVVRNKLTNQTESVFGGDDE